MILLTPNSIQTIIIFKINSGESNQNIIKFNNWRIIETVRKVPKNCPENVQKRQKRGGFLSKIESSDSIYDSFIHFTIKFNSKDCSITFSSENSFQKFWFGCIQFNKIFIQLENSGIALRPPLTAKHLLRICLGHTWYLYFFSTTTIWGQIFHKITGVRLYWSR